jgi:hypothetical protein
MHKSAWLAVIVLAVVAFATNLKSSGSTPNTLTTPQIVASGKLVNQSGNFTSTIYTPGISGLYRICGYATITTADSSSTSQSFYGFSWTDISGITSGPAYLLGTTDNAVGPFYDNISGYSIGGFCRTLQVMKGTPITHRMEVDQNPDSSKYDVVYTLERLE